MSSAARFRQFVVASDPGHTRLVNAAATTGAVLISILGTQAVITATHGRSDLLVTGGIFTMITFGGTHDATPGARWVTSAMLTIPALLGAVAAFTFAQHRVVAAAVFVAIAGIGVWARRFGVRGSTLGMACFFGYMLVLLAASGGSTGLVDICLVIGVAALAGVFMRSLLLIEHPRRRLVLLLSQFRTACDAAVRASRTGGRDEPRRQLDQITAIALALEDWQDDFTGIDRITLSRRTFDAQTATEMLCRELARSSTASTAPEPHRDPTPSDVLIDELLVVLTTQMTPEQRAAATELADRSVDTVDKTAPGGLAALFAARAIIAHVALLDSIDPASPKSVVVPIPRKSPMSTAPASTAPASTAQAPPALPESTGTEHRGPRMSLLPTTRMAIQVTVAATLAAVVGESISATRWYWAVLTAFVVFLGSATRGSILTKSYRRIVGTAAGIVLGAGLAIVIVHHPVVQITMCLVCIFCAYYFGPLNMAILAMFITLMLAPMYDLLGILTWELALDRLTETAAGAAIGVVCAYLIMSTSCRDTVVEKVDAYFDALDDFVVAVVDALTGTGGAQTSSDENGGDEAGIDESADPQRVVDSLRSLDAASKDVRAAFADMAAVMVVGVGREHRARVITLRWVNDDAHLVARAVVAAVEGGCPATFVDDDAERVRRAGELLRRHAEHVRRVFTDTVDDDTDAGVDTADRDDAAASANTADDLSITHVLRPVDAPPSSAPGVALAALARLDHTLDELPAAADRGVEHPHLQRVRRAVHQRLPHFA